MQHERQQSLHFAFARCQLEQHPAKPDGFIREPAPIHIHVVPANAECRVNCLKHSVESFRQVLALGYLEADTTFADFCLRPHQALSHRLG